MNQVFHDVAVAVELEASNTEACTMKKRWTTLELISSFCDQVEEAHNDYRQRIEKAIRFLASNVGKAQKLDSVLGTLDDCDAVPGSDSSRAVPRTLGVIQATP